MIIPFMTLVDKEISRFMKVIVQTVFSPILSSFLYLLIFGVSLGSSIQMKNGEVYLAFLIPGLVVMGLINNAFQNTSSSIITSKFSGDIEDIRVAPIGHNQIVWAMGIAGVFRGALVGLVTGIVGEIFFYFQNGSLLAIEHPFMMIFFTLAGGFIFSFCGIFVAFIAKTFDQLSAFSSFILLPLTYLGGVFISTDNLSPFFQKLSHANPLFYLINGFRYSILGHSDVQLPLALGMTSLAMLITFLMARFALKNGSYSRW
jgi:ABC-2 type transport system permease protein